MSIIVPVLNEAEGIVTALEALASWRAAGAEVIVVDGGSSDDTVARATPLADRVITSRAGRARQMNAGAALAQGDLLLFLHADTRLPDAVDLCTESISWGRFDVTIEGNSVWLDVIASLMNWRSRLTGIATGDQAIFVRRELFRQIGGYADIPLMEDIVLSARLKRSARPRCLRQRVRTSGRRWQRQGIARTIWLMWRLRLRFFFGADPRVLAREYGYEVADD